ncbi:MAG: secondary thiamine-phosphate synthase enzyme [Flavobacteriales bacterium]|jgi:secondary thiamine-phosphate synthase enzyme|tara:strand:- start:6478 stop:6882 length:405 start_codon:yes stop_codon:yes gene_type:complete
MVQFEITLPALKRGFHIITQEILSQIDTLPQIGLCSIFIKHTSAAITINEAADPSVLTDFESSFNLLIPENAPHYVHTYEGSDDMPAHLKTSIIGTNVTIPITNHQFNLGTWQGIYLCEFRNFASPRSLVITVY